MAQDVGFNGAAVFAEEGFVVELQVFLHSLMEKKGVSRSDLAKKMGVSKARISQIFSDECKNFTVRLLARAVFALGEKAVIECESDKKNRECGKEWSDMFVDPEDLPLIWSVQRDFAEMAVCVAANDVRPGRLNGYSFSPMEWEAA